MPIVIQRRAEAQKEPHTISKEQKELAWEAIIKAYISKHPEVLQKVEVIP